ncbi:TetR/AcrR family transcriptional regulator [Actinomadura sp. KC345]|uniref:TetR/AcrR family transcriptional regulator n=1 Tax=Actinomadura sp. KC345 TaxID=2530371 RepID=UPI001050AF8E|nr:TetR/AcrR family transcriptional regulator [Actinomadura sp. KC345]TDC58277.1 TetR/AcrR family transcriptional regulator [Actinomadura sp. KC345]
MAGRERPEDLTGRARIRDAALLEFARLGVKGATIRGIAKAAGVSPALVQHHYGTKEELRRACDEHVIEVIREVKQEALSGGMANPGFLAVAMRTALPIQRYVARAMTDGSEAARKLFDDSVEFSKEVMGRGMAGVSEPRTDDLHAYAAVLTAMNVGLMVLHEHLSRALGADVLVGDGYPRMALAMLDIYDDRIMSPELIEQSRTALKSLLADGAQSSPEENP